MLRLWLALLVFLLVTPPAAALEENPFPRPAALEADVQFWIRIYSEVGTDGGLIHDSRHLGVVYEVMRFPSGLSSRSRQRRIDASKRRIRAILDTLARGKRSGLSAEEARVLALWPDGVGNTTLRQARSNLRFQLGQANKFRAGIIRSGAWEPHIRATFSDMGLPIELAALPHVESSYTPHAYSRVGAAGLWQFTRSTGRRFMRVDHVVDERLDPYKATIAAARLLEQNRSTTGSWPLAITAYNHGAAGMRRAVRKLGTRDIHTIVRKYRSRTFGFASRNFYLEFLAAADVDFHAERYFGPLHLDSPIAYETVEVPFYTTTSALARALGVDNSVLKAANPALRSSVWRGAKYVPRGFELRMPRSELAKPLQTALAAVPAGQRFAKQQRDTYHVVGRGETLSRIASRYGVSQNEIVALNGLRSRHRIRVGQRLRLPDVGGTRRAVARAPVTPVAPPKNGVHVVRRGENLTVIAARYGLDEQTLARSNGLRNRNRIYVGQRLRVGDAPVAATAPATPVEVAKAKPAAQVEAPSAATEPAVEAVAEPEAVASIDADAVALEPDETENAAAPESATEIATAETEPGVAAVDVRAENEAPAPAGSRALEADPSDYSVAGDGSIEVQAAETLGHYAEWLGIRASRLRSLNRMRYGAPLVLGRRLKLEFSRVPKEDFERQRVSYQRSLQGDFFARYEIHGTKTHVMRRGDSLWTLSKRRYGVPLWLIRQYNPDLDFSALHAGTRITIPLIKPHDGAGADATAVGAPAARKAQGNDAQAEPS